MWEAGEFLSNNLELSFMMYQMGISGSSVTINVCPCNAPCYSGENLKIHTINQLSTLEQKDGCGRDSFWGLSLRFGESPLTKGVNLKPPLTWLNGDSAVNLCK